MLNNPTLAQIELGNKTIAYKESTLCHRLQPLTIRRDDAYAQAWRTRC